MAVKIYENGAWRNATQVKRVESGAWQDVGSANRYENGAWNKVWPTEVQVGETVSFVSTPIPYNVKVSCKGDPVASVGYFSKQLTPGYYTIWADEAHWYWIEFDGIDINFILYQQNIGRCDVGYWVDDRFVSRDFRPFGYADTRAQDVCGDNFASIDINYPCVKVTGEGIVEMRGQPVSCDLVTNEWGYPTLKVTNATMTKIANL